MSKNTNELKIGSPGRFGIDVYTLGWPMGARILGHEDAAPAVPSINSSCMRLANFLQPECFGRLHVGCFESRRRLYSWVEV